MDLKQFKKRKSATSYLLKEIPPYLWEQAKHHAVDERITLNALLIRALMRYFETPLTERQAMTHGVKP